MSRLTFTFTLALTFAVVLTRGALGLVGHALRRARGALVVAGGLLFVGATGCVAPGPELIIEQAAEAARNNDREALLACFTPRSRPLIETWWHKTDEHNPALARLGANEVEVTGVQIISSRDYMPERAVIQIREGQDTARVYAHRLGGMWRIDLLDTERAMFGYASDP